MSQFRVTSLLAAVSVASCSFVEPRPSDWPAAESVQIDRCPDLSGAYTNDGDLFDHLTAEGVWGRHDCQGCPVDIWWADEDQKELAVRISYYGGSKREPRFITEILRAHDGDYRCEAGKLIVGYYGIGVSFAGGVEVGEVFFERGDDGSILIERRYEYFGHWMLLPMIQYVVEHDRWVPLSRELADIEGLPTDQAISVVSGNVGKARNIGTLTARDWLDTYRLQDTLDSANVGFRDGNIYGTCRKLAEVWQALNGNSAKAEGPHARAISDQVNQLRTSLDCGSVSKPP